MRINMRAGVIAQPWAVVQGELDRVCALAQQASNAVVGTGIIPYDTPPEALLRARAYLAELG